MKKPKVIVLTPRFVQREGSSYFDGYDQVAGTHFFDDAGKLYVFVAADDYNTLAAQSEKDAAK